MSGIDGFEMTKAGLACEGVPLKVIAAEAGTPTYVYSANAMRRRLRGLQAAFAGDDALFCYAIKANSNRAIVRLLAGEGAGADVVSGGELVRALDAGVPPSMIVYAGVAKTDDELQAALKADILQFNVESLAELDRLGVLAAGLNVEARVALRVNPDVAADTHAKISTGRKGDKFGIDLDEAPAAFAHAKSLPGIVPVGVHLHIGSQIYDVGPLEAAYAKGAGLFAGLQAGGYPMQTLDLGGGFGITEGGRAALDPVDLARAVRRATVGLGAKLLFEPGRYLVAEAGVLLARVVWPKETGGRRFLVLDAGMHTLVRVAMYDAWHDVRPVRPIETGEPMLDTDVVGPICESSDVFGRDRKLPRLTAGDLVVLTSAGAYGAVMASNYNSRVGAAEVLVDDGRHALIRPQVDVAAQMAMERVPAWLMDETA